MTIKGVGSLHTLPFAVGEWRNVIYASIMNFLNILALILGLQ
jgi:hypothetical protein